MQLAPHSELPKENLDSLEALCNRAPLGCAVEIGVYQGGSAYRLKNRVLHLFDTFTGIPERADIDMIGVGEFSDTSVDKVREFLPHAIFHVGKFPDTLTDDVKDIGFLHIDCDQYETCKSALDLLTPRMVKGGIIAFDDYPFPGIQKAIHDKFGQCVNFTDVKIPYVIVG